MPAAIIDSFAAVPSRQRRYQLRNMALGLCSQCRCPNDGGVLCPACRKLTHVGVTVKHPPDIDLEF